MSALRTAPDFAAVDGRHETRRDMRRGGAVIQLDCKNDTNFYECTIGAPGSPSSIS
jgi:hypothetical protein